MKKVNTGSNNITCERCGEKLDPKRAKMLELSNTDGNYYVEIPAGHESQGGFYFGTTCATKQLQETVESIKNTKS